MTGKERLDQRRALLREKAGADFTLIRDGKVLRSRRSYTTEEWADHLAEQKKRLELRLKAAGSERERQNLRRELRSWELMEQFSITDNNRKESRTFEDYY